MTAIPGLIVGFANDGIAGVPGVLRVTVESQDGKCSVQWMPGCRLSATRQNPASSVCASQGDKMATPEAEGANRSERNAVSGALGLSSKTQRRWLADSAFQPGLTDLIAMEGSASTLPIVLRSLSFSFLLVPSF